MKKETRMTETSDMSKQKDKRDEARDLRWASNVCCLWRVCADAKCRRAKTTPRPAPTAITARCRRACANTSNACSRRNGPPRPSEDFRDSMEDTDAADGYFAWRNAARQPAR
jgi:hypothetical protein